MEEFLSDGEGSGEDELADAPPRSDSASGAEANGGKQPSAEAAAVDDAAVDDARPSRGGRRKAPPRRAAPAPAAALYQYIVMDCAEGGDMEEAIKQQPGLAWPEEQARYLGTTVSNYTSTDYYGVRGLL